MANNRLFIRNRKTGEYTGFLESFGNGWEIRKTAEQIEHDVKELWDDGSFGNCYDAATDLELVTENDPRYKEVDGLLLDSKQTVTPVKPMKLRDRVPLMAVETTTGTDPRVVHPDGDPEDAPATWPGNYKCWCQTTDDVTVELIGTAAPGTPEGVVLASFNAG